MNEVYTYVGGPLDGQTFVYTGTASWWGFYYDKDGVKGEYNTRPYNTYKQKPYEMYWWEEGSPRHMNPDWECPDTVDVDDELLEDHIRRLIEAQDGQQG